MNQLTIKNSIIEIFVGDLTNTEYDGLVIPTNSRLLPSGELRCKVLRKAGVTVQVECNRIINKIIKVAVGSAVITSGGNLKNYIIHINGPKLGQGNEAKKLMLSTWNSLKIADEAGLTSLVMPPISKNMLGFTAKLCAEVMLPTIKKYVLEKNQNLKNVSICLETLPDYKEFENVLDTIAI
ncbi:MAG: macro domain-containing protein [Promethearchaeota archaeon]